ncbi:MAG TPA: CoA ester lyase [Deltaproteobacteria bacterium]|nr:CoA ester lyase [Deltaproteobacteria bacterium]
MKLDPDRCRSLLFVPAGNKRFVNSAMRGHADVIQLDLEDAIAPSQKQAARESARMELETIDAAGRVVSVRVNVDDSLLAADLEGVVHPGLSALTIPKVESSEMLAAIDQQVSRLESKRSMPSGEIQLIAQIESSKGILNVREIAHASPRLAALGIGMEDLIANVGGTVGPDALYFPAMQTLYAAREAGVTPIGYLGSITVYKDIKLFQEWAMRAKALGFDGGFCIHPNQVAILNDSFRPTPEEVDAAQGIVNAVEQHKEAGIGAFSHDGKMVDAPVVERARRVLRLHQSYSL